ncbi:HAMP domain-containing histidine kinase [Saccharopolyspora hirsuta]|uniref:Signal transduction histidine-protein kinase/phosphatase MprB n=1 Tax=Saccharopolyspora hirsuta TaxID=1837 RepID=A0A5M7C5M7_SACHI|nr:HAMP domain-containing sensor histidine kinase [Saccharopolyspora hirsuta]KAA5833605.1 HAMP domain-containing histidine kinase [Saccharopolyspora hirsuta]
MRRTVVLVALAVTSMVALAFLIPLGLMIREMARDQAMSDAERQAVALAPVLATTDDPALVGKAVASTRAGQLDRIAVHLPDGGVVGTSRAGAGDVRLALVDARTATVEVPGGAAFVQPIALDGGRTAVVEVFVPEAEQARGVLRSWLVLGGVGLLLVIGSLLVADRLAAQMVRATIRLADASSALGAGDLGVRVDPSGPPELVAAGQAFNTMADRVRQLLAAEREMAADLSHRLRTPLTALRLNAEALGDDQAAEQTRLAIDRLEREVDLVITSARRAGPGEDPDCDVAALLRERLEFWSALAEDQQRPWSLRGADGSVRVPVPGTELAASVDAVVGNVFRHTPERTEFVVSLQRNDGVVGVIVEDAGPGVAELSEAVQRGRSSAGSTGLGLDIARRVAESTGGRLAVDRSSLGGARVCMWLWQRPAAPRSTRRRDRRRTRPAR